VEPVSAFGGVTAARPRQSAATGRFDLALARASEPRPQPSRPLSGIGPTPRAWEAAQNPEFRHRIAEAERSAEHARHGYGQRNPVSGALGRYQFLPSTLLDIGWKTADGRWSAIAQRHGVASEADFLANPEAQEAAMSAFLRRVEVQIERNGALARQGQRLRGLNGEEIALTESGLVAAAHRRGAGTLARYLAHRANTPDAPLSARERAAFQQVERRLLDFQQVAYASMRGTPAPGPARALAQAGGAAAGG
jgi:hypothetical protein